jgi:pimeloyl-ACP methyl ester carboxylesterase/AraC-like DNA-binding protein
MKPITKYTKSGRINIAYQVFGTGAVDLVYIPGWVSNIDLMWANPEMVQFLTELGKMARVILFDKRGTGLSDRIVELCTLEERMDDIRAVMDAVNAQKAVLFGHSEGGSVSALFAATYPNRTRALMTFGVFAKRTYASTYPWAPSDTERQKVYDMIESSWGSGEMNLESLAPSKANDKVFMDWLADYFRSGASPSAALVLTKMNTKVDIIDILPSINVPTLIMQRKNDIDVKLEEGKFIADRIKGATFLELEGDDHLFWIGNTEEILCEMASFIGTKRVVKEYEKKLCTIVTAQIDPRKEKEHQQLVLAKVVGQFRGKIVSFETGFFTAVFDGPSKAVHCAIDIVNESKAFAWNITIAIHVKECLLSEVSHTTHPLTQAMLQKGETGQILLTQTVKNLIGGTGLQCTPFTTLFDPEHKEPILLFYVKDQLDFVKQSCVIDANQLPYAASLLENVLDSIDQNLGNEHYGVEMLAERIGVSERQLQRRLKLITNKTPNQLILSVRLHRAKELLSNRQENIAEVAYKTGFANPSYFSKSFRKEFGITPSESIK